MSQIPKLKEKSKRRTRQQCEWYDGEGKMFTCFLAKQPQCFCVGPKCGYWKHYK